MPSIADLAAFAVAAGMALMGVVALLRPDRVTRQFGCGELGVDARSEVRAVYGGYGLAMAGLLLGATVATAHRTGVFWTVALALAGMAFGRIVSALKDRRLGKAPALYLVVELLGAALLMASA
jgi:uncharacterized membrane protein YeaQ/YmgE (transglycosylase-associated protein family)